MVVQLHVSLHGSCIDDPRSTTVSTVPASRMAWQPMKAQATKQPSLRRSHSVVYKVTTRGRGLNV